MKFVQEQVLIPMLKHGDQSAVRMWYSQSKLALKKFFIVSGIADDDVEELVHDTYLSCLSALPLFRGESGLYTWMISIARHELTDYWRKKYAKRVIRFLPRGEELLALAQVQPKSSESLIKDVLRKLPVATAELLQLKYIDNLSVSELAQHFGVDVTTMQSRVYRARMQFQKLYEEETGESYETE